MVKTEYYRKRLLNKLGWDQWTKQAKLDRTGLIFVLVISCFNLGSKMARLQLMVTSISVSHLSKNNVLA